MQAVHWVIAVQFLFQQINFLLQNKKFLEELSTMPRRKTPRALHEDSNNERSNQF
jgi:hypothetical protein